MQRYFRSLLLAAALACTGVAAAGPADRVEAELVSEFDSLAPGRSATVALRLRHAPHWHTYWQVPGESGLPTQIKWTLPAGFAASDIQWPVPQRLPAGPLVNFGYEGEVLLLTQLSVPADVQGESVQLAARADWLVCNDVCIPGGADLSLALPIRRDGAPQPSAFAPAIAATRARLPQPLALTRAEAVRDGGTIRLLFEAGAAAPQTLTFFPLEADVIAPSAPQVLRIDGKRANLSLTATAQTVDAKHLRGVLVADGGESWFGTIELPLAVAAAGPAAAAATAPAAMTLWFALAGAFVGGLILNLMPCVFPVLSLKLLALAQHRHGERMRAHGLVFMAGAVLSFTVLAAVLIALQSTGAQLGWGFQLQTPWVVVALALLFFLIGLNLLGTFELTAASGLANSRVAQSVAGEAPAGSLRASFGTGVLAVVVASPCTAPFMGAALGFAVTQPAIVALSVFAALGVGMATPYLLLTAFPRWLARLPRPGMWMERFKQAMAFPMFATVVWLLWVLAQQVGPDATAQALLALVLGGLFAWAYGVAQRGGRRFHWLAWPAAAATLLTAGVATGPGAVAPQATAPADASAHWQRWSPAAQQELLSAGKPLFVDFTAAWCVTCQVNKRIVLNTPQVQQAFAARGVTLMRADWTNSDPDITRELANFQRNGVPLYVLYDGRGGSVVLPELLTADAVLGPLQQLAPAPRAEAAATGG
jgi:thiol:disulfide interchange protein DsbD